MRVSNNPWVIDGGFSPFTMQEMLTPFLLYKDAWDKSQEQMDKYNQGADAFSYLDETLPEGSKARSIYDNYSKDLRNAEQSFSQNGLTADNSRALLGLRRRYTGEIGRLEKASTKLEKLRNLRMAQDAQDPTMIYTVDNPTIDDVLDDKNFNQYSISGNSLYKMGMTSGAAISQRHISNLELQKLKNPAFLDAVQRVGFTPEVLQAFNVNPNAIPEFKEAINSIMKSTKADTNLTGIKKEQAVQNVIRGLIDGAVYKQNDSIQRDYSVMTASEAAADQRQREQNQLQREQFNYMKQKDQREENFFYTHDANGNRTGYNTTVLGGNGENVPNGFYRDPKDGQLKRTPKGYKPDASSPTGLVKDDSSGSSSSKQERYDNKLLALNSDDLANNKGFDVQANGNRYHYNYIGAIAAQNGGWVSGAIGDDVPHRGWGFTSSSNVMNKWGNFSAEGADYAGKKGMRVLSTSEMQTLLANNPELSNEIGKRIKAANVDPNSADIQIIEVPNEKGNARKGYLIAVH